MDAYRQWLREVLELAGEIHFKRMEAKLWAFAEPFYAWLGDVLQRPYSGWQDTLDEFLAEQAAEGRTIAPEIRQSIIDYVEARLVRTQSGSERFPYLGRSGRHPSNSHLYFWLPPGTGFTDEDLVLAHDIALLTWQLRGAIDESTARLDDPSFLDEINPLADSPITQLRKIADMKAELSELELLYTLLGYDRISWNRFTRQPERGLQGAEAHVPFAGPEHGIRRVTVETFMTVWGVGSLASLARKLLAKGVTRLARRAASRALKSIDDAVDDVVIDRYGTLSRASDPPGQTHHLNQSAAYRNVIPRDNGLSIKLEGNILQDATAPHTRAHQSLELFWNAYRGTDIVPTNLAYTRALKESLRAAGLSEAQVAQAVRAAVRERVQYGLLGGKNVPAIPRAIRNLSK